MKIVAGIDVGKASLEVSVSAGPVRSFDNTAAGVIGLREWLASQGVTLVVCEPTGGYERQLVEGLLAAHAAVHVAHPNKTRAFARACGYQAKTDQFDAQTLSRYGEVFELPSVLACTDLACSLDDVVQVDARCRRREQLVSVSRVQERNHALTARAISQKVRRLPPNANIELAGRRDLSASRCGVKREALQSSAELSHTGGFVPLS